MNCVPKADGEELDIASGPNNDLNNNRANNRGNGLTDLNISWEVSHDLASAERQWRQLENEGHHRVFQNFAWIETWYSAIGAKSGIDPRIVIGSVEGQPRILFPLGIDRYLGCKRLVWLGWNWNDYNAPIVTSSPDFGYNQQDALAMWDKVVDLAGPIDVLELAKQAPDLAHDLPNLFYHPKSFSEDNSAYVLDLQKDVEALMASIHSAKTWKGFRRKCHKLQRAGEVKFEEITGETRLQKLARNMLEVKAVELAMHGGGNPFESQENIDFLTRIAQTQPQISRLFALTLDGQPVATTICLIEKTNLIMYQTSYDRAYANISPGALLLHHIIKTAAAEGYLTFDLSFGDDEYKKSICSRVQKIDRAMIATSGKGKLLMRMQQMQLAMRRQAKANPLIYNAVLAVNRKLRLTAKTP